MNKNSEEREEIESYVSPYPCCHYSKKKIT